MFADDTICTSHDTRTITKILAAIELEGLANGMKLNKGKCEALVFNKNANVHFGDGTAAPQKNSSDVFGVHGQYTR